MDRSGKCRNRICFFYIDMRDGRDTDWVPDRNQGVRVKVDSANLLSVAWCNFAQSSVRENFMYEDYFSYASRRLMSRRTRDFSLPTLLRRSVCGRSLRIEVLAGEGFIVVTGEPGTGKQLC